MRMRMWMWVSVIAATLVAADSAGAAEKVSSKEETREGKTYVTIENPFLELTFEPFQGGRCSKFVIKATGEEIVGPEKLSGMFKDHWAKYSWPSGLMWLPYQYRIVGDKKTRIGIQLMVKVPEKGGGKGADSAESSLNMPTSPDLIGLVVEKTIWLNADNDAIEVKQEIKNPLTESRAVAPYIQQGLYMGGKRYHHNWYLPSDQGVVVNVQPEDENGRAIGPDWVLKPTDGWIAVNDRQTKSGIVFVFDYDYVEKIYTSGETAEWFMEAVPVGPGKSFKYEYVVKPIKNFEDIVHGSNQIVVDIRPDEKGGKINVAFDVAAVTQELFGVTADFRIVGWKSKEEIAKQSLSIPKLGFDKIRKEFSFAPKNLADGLVIKAIVRTKDFEDRFEYYYAGDKEEYERRYNWFATKGGALAGARGDSYFVKQRRKRKEFDKSGLPKAVTPAADKFKTLVVFGLYTHILNIDDALAGWTHKGHAPEFTWANCPPNAIETFPGTYEELFSFNSVVLSDVNFKAVGDIGFEMICDYVERGGSLLVVGGPYALGNGEFEGTRFLEVLPVRLSGPFDLKWAGKGKSWDLKGAKEGHPVLEDVSFVQNPRVFWHHFVRPKSGAEVVLNAGEEPTLILGSYGRGKVAVLTLSPTGLGAEGETQWWDWEGWFPLVKNIFTWLSE